MRERGGKSKEKRNGRVYDGDKERDSDREREREINHTLRVKRAGLMGHML